ncbi:hypothetical protein glysoja_026159 [Glycine soja]|uniref:Uncharacterized protein n=1 Tax=Glycine soja TaxID=3848 RepID=A0A0B2PXN2_GLYSO|nr:hypothetical protein glysoja_026159 [Glycine soja]
MGDVLSPFTISSPPPPSSPSTKNNSMPMLYYGLVVVGTAASHIQPRPPKTEPNAPRAAGAKYHA